MGDPDRRHPRRLAAGHVLYPARGSPARRSCGPRSLCVWYDSPFDAAWVVALLREHTDPHWRQVLQQARRKPATRALIERALGRCPQAGDPVEFEIFQARLQLYPSADVLRRSLAVEGDKDDLYRAGGHYWETIRGVLGNQEMCGPVGLIVNSSQFGLYTFSTMAIDEAQARRRIPPPVPAAYREIARSSGPWWAFAHAVIFTDRPAEIHVNERHLLHRSDGPAAVYRDGAQVWAVEGHAVRPPKPRPAAPRKAQADPAHYLDRYLAGEHAQVWAELIALGPSVREPASLASAEAVARETMHRVAKNVGTVVARLRRMKYTFKNFEMYSPDFKGPDLRLHTPPGPETPDLLRQLDELAGPVPLSLRAFYKIVGWVNLIGYHPGISPEDQGYFRPDPLVIFPLSAMLEEMAALGDTSSIDLAPDDFHKADYSGGAPYGMALPDPRADGEFLNEKHHLFFVDYLRMVFRNGGFPGYEGLDRGVPKEIAALSKGLLPF